MNAKIQKLLRDGEGLTVEFKRCHDKLSHTVYETVCAFSNRYGGDVLLGVEDDGTVTGVAPEAVKQLKKDFANALNNPQMFQPTLFVELEEAEIDGKMILYCHVPLTSQLVMYNSKIFDRNADGDFDVTRSPDLIWQIGARKKGLSTEDKIYPFITARDLLLDDLMPKVRIMATTRIVDHPWKSMPDIDILKSAGLYQLDRESGHPGYTLAAILLLGREEVIRSVLPGYVTDCILRRDNLDRYDDRLRVSCNLIEAFDKIMEFISKHTLDRFYIEGVLSISPRSKMARELVSNILAHREFTSTVPAKVIIERDRIVTENWCLPKLPGKLTPETFTPQPKNPLIANFFVNIGYADALGSGVRNLYKYTKIYTNGGEPELIEGDIFRTTVPLSLIGMSDNAQTSDKAIRDTLLAYLQGNGEVTAAEAAAMIDRATSTARRLLAELVAEGIVVATGANRNRRYKVKR
ncbi:MAG: putative DNA binding domain-containing protein [Oscillospiraceae bacterium]|jgi:ATP-dependent DNA helicase RecG|nr:putative DNA binding domain-containing protein [Oscillospiraceae bacterium]